MTDEQLNAEIREANLTYLMLAQNLIRRDKAEAQFRLGISEESADLMAAHALQDQLTLTGAAPAAAPATIAPAHADWPQFFTGVQQLLLESPPPATDQAVLRRIAGLGITPRGGFDPARFSPTQSAEIAAGVAERG